LKRPSVARNSALKQSSVPENHQAIKKTAPAFTPYQFNANQYVPKVNNFVVIMDSSYSMNDKYGAKTKGEINKEFLMALNQTIPDLGYHAELITYDKIEYGSTRYSTDGFGKALHETAEPNGNSCMPQPVVGNDTREGRAKNRRVELRPVK